MEIQQNNMSFYAVFNSDRKFIFIEPSVRIIDSLPTGYGNKDLYRIICGFDNKSMEGSRVYPIYFVLHNDNPVKLQDDSIKLCFHISENFNIPSEYLDIYYCINTTEPFSADIIVTIPSVVFNNVESPFISWINYLLAIKINNFDIETIDIDVYYKDYSVKLLNSFNTKSQRYAIPLSVEELIGIDISGLDELAKNPRPQDSFIRPKIVPDAENWLSRLLSEYQVKNQQIQNILKQILCTGWQVPECINRIQRLTLYDESRLAAYRAIAQFFAWIGANQQQITSEICRTDWRNPLKNSRLINAIISFACENKCFDCNEHEILRKFCRPNNCFIKELTESSKQNLLFE